jgi:hypothetical protein
MLAVLFFRAMMKGNYHAPITLCFFPTFFGTLAVRYNAPEQTIIRLMRTADGTYENLNGIIFVANTPRKDSAMLDIAGFGGPNGEPLPHIYDRRIFNPDDPASEDLGNRINQFYA